MKKHLYRILSLLAALMLITASLPLGVFAESGESRASLTITGSKYVAKGKKVTLKASEAVTWKTSDKKIATVSSKGVVKGIKAGKVTITAVSKADKSVKKAWKMTVTKKAAKSISIKASSTELDLSGNKTATLKAAVSPSAAAQSVTWKSSNTKVATVTDKGKVTAVGNGKAKITATATDGSKVSAKIEITVSEPEPITANITVWCADTELTEELIREFKESRSQYRDCEFTVVKHSESEAINEYEAADVKPDLIVFPQDQIARFVSLGALAAVSTSSFASDCGKGAVSAVTVGSKAYGFPITADNGYFLYYDKSVVTNPDSLEAILADCEKAGRKFHMELTSGWYNAAFFFGAGCTIEFSVGSDGSITGVTADVGSAKGVKALKAMETLASSPAFFNNSSAGNMDSRAAALVSGTWDAAAVNEMWGSNYAAAKLPTVGGFQLGSFSGHKIIGVCKGSSDHVTVSTALAEYLSSTDAQVRRADKYGWVPARNSAQKKVKLGLSAQALMAQNQFSVPQGPIHGGFWSIAADVANTIIEKAGSLTDSDLSRIAGEFESALKALVQ